MLVTFRFLVLLISQFPALVFMVLLTSVLEVTLELKICKLCVVVDKHALTVSEYEQLVSLFFVVHVCLLCISTMSYS